MWSSVIILGVSPVPRARHTFTAASDNQIVLHGGYNTDGAPVGDTWIFNTDLQEWRQHPGPPDDACFSHCAVKANNNSVMILGGTDTHVLDIASDAEINIHSNIHWVRLEPDSLRKLCLKAVMEHIDVSKLTPMDIPKSLLANLQEMYDKDVKPIKELLMPVSNEGDEKITLKQELSLPASIEGDEKITLKQELLLPASFEGDEKITLRLELSLPGGKEDENIKVERELPVSLPASNKGDDKTMLRIELSLPANIEGDEKITLKQELSLPANIEGDEEITLKQELSLPASIEGDEKVTLKQEL